MFGNFYVLVGRRNELERRQVFAWGRIMPIKLQRKSHRAARDDALVTSDILRFRWSWLATSWLCTSIRRSCLVMWLKDKHLFDARAVPSPRYSSPTKRTLCAAHGFAMTRVYRKLINVPSCLSHLLLVLRNTVKATLRNPVSNPVNPDE